MARCFANHLCKCFFAASRLASSLWFQCSLSTLYIVLLIIVPLDYNFIILWDQGPSDCSRRQLVYVVLFFYYQRTSLWVYLRVGSYYVLPVPHSIQRLCNCMWLHPGRSHLILLSRVRRLKGFSCQLSIVWILINGNPSFMSTQYSCEVGLWRQSIPSIIICQRLLALSKLYTIPEQFLVWIINVYVIWHWKFSFMFHNFLLAREGALCPSRCLVISQDLFWL